MIIDATGFYFFFWVCALKLHIWLTNTFIRVDISPYLHDNFISIGIWRGVKHLDERMGNIGNIEPSASVSTT